MSKYLLKTFSVLFIITIVIRIVDVGKNLFVSSKIGVSEISDIYLALITIPDSILILIGFDTIRGVVNSEYSSMDINSEIVRNSFKNLFTLLILGSFFIVLILMLFNNAIISFLLPGFVLSKKEVALNLSLIIFPIIFFKSINTLLTAFYNASHTFYFPVFSQIIITISIIVSIFIPNYKDSIIYNISLGLLVGNILYTGSLLIPIFKKFGFNLFSLKLNDLTKRILKNCLALIFLVIINQLYLSSRNFITSYFPDGSLSALNYATSITSFISGMTFNTVFSVILATFANSISINEIKSVRVNFFNTIQTLVFLYVPIVATFILFNKEILSLLFLRGKFDLNGIELTSKVFTWESLSLIPFIFSFIPTALYLAKKDYRKLTYIGVTTYLSGILVSALISYIIGFYGVSVASFITYAIHGILLMWFCKSYVGGFSKEEVILLSKLLLSGIFTCIIVYYSKSLVYFDFSNLILSQKILYFLTGGFLTFGVYFALATVLKANFFFKAKNLLMGK